MLERLEQAAVAVPLGAAASARRTAPATPSTGAQRLHHPHGTLTTTHTSPPPPNAPALAIRGREPSPPSAPFVDDRFAVDEDGLEYSACTDEHSRDYTDDNTYRSYHVD